MPGTVTPAKAKQRTIKLDVNANDLVSKNIHAEVDDGSLPCSPDSLPDIEGLTCTAAYEALEADTRELIAEALSDVTDQATHRWLERPAQTTMKRVVSELLEKHRYVYKGIIQKLTESQQGNDLTFVNTVAKSMFADGKTNWGRITSLVAFGATVCQYLKEQEHEQMDSVSLVSHEISSYLILEQREWLLQNNSWDGFVEFFRVSDPESVVRNALMAVVGVAGIGVSLAMLLR